MKHLLTLACFLAAYVFLPQPGNAATAYVKSGKTTLIAQLVGWDKRCRSTGYARVIFLKKPRHGRASSRRGGRYPIPSKTSIGRAGKCKGKRIRGVGIYYRSNRNFRGRDTIRFKARAGNGKRYYTYQRKVIVR